jgi:hypothetical protein
MVGICELPLSVGDLSFREGGVFDDVRIIVAFWCEAALGEGTDSGLDTCGLAMLVPLMEELRAAF